MYAGVLKHNKRYIITLNGYPMTRDSFEPTKTQRFSESDCYYFELYEDRGDIGTLETDRDKIIGTFNFYYTKPNPYDHDTRPCLCDEDDSQIRECTGQKAVETSIATTTGDTESPIAHGT